MNATKNGPHSVFICVGSNIGDKRKNCETGIDALVRPEDTSLVARSACYKTEPVDYTDQDWFINMAVKIETELGPSDLLYRLKRIERMAGRQKGIRFGPRILDLDIILYDSRIIRKPGLFIPHPRMHVRRFVLEPLCDIDPEIVHPLFKRSMRQLLDNLEDDTQRVIQCS